MLLCRALSLEPGEGLYLTATVIGVLPLVDGMVAIAQEGDLDNFHPTKDNV